jgi:hypothetical protein
MRSFSRQKRKARDIISLPHSLTYTDPRTGDLETHQYVIEVSIFTQYPNQDFAPICLTYFTLMDIRIRCRDVDIAVLEDGVTG